MSPDELRRAYSSFFKSSAGKYFMDTINDLVESNHVKAEDNPELARDFAQRAKGMREIGAHVKSVVAEGKKPISK